MPTTGGAVCGLHWEGTVHEFKEDGHVDNFILYMWMLPTPENLADAHTTPLNFEFVRRKTLAMSSGNHMM